MKKKKVRGTARKYVVSRFVQIVRFNDISIVTHGPLLKRLSLDSDLAALLREFRGKGLTLKEFQRSTGSSREAKSIFSFFKEKNFIVPHGTDEKAQLKEALHIDQVRLGQTTIDAHEKFNTPALFSVDSVKGSSRTELKPLKAMLVGGCPMDFMKDYLSAGGHASGYSVTTDLEWLSSPEQLKTTITAKSPDLVVLHLGFYTILSPLWDGLAFTSPTERRERLESAKSLISSYVHKLAEVATGRLILVQNIAALQASPLGRGGFRQEMSFREIHSELNLHIERELRPYPNLMLVDEDLISSRIGVASLFDDMHFPFSHHGGTFDIQTETPNQLPLLSQVFAREYLECYQLWQGAARIKCVVCDLDGTLWPGIAAESEFDWLDRDSTSRFIYFGIHQALKVMKARGILLTTSSKNTEGQTLESWSRAVKPGSAILSPNDFVVHKINWERKSKAIAEIADTIGIGLDSILFIDDNPVEREEVRQSLPQVQVYDGPIPELRKFLLNNPRLEVNVWTEEAGARSEMTRAQIQRDAARKTMVSENEFLRSLKVTASVRRETDQRNLARITELVQRTNQFNTTLVRYDSETLVQNMKTSGVEMYSLTVSDRFTSYGLVGFVLLRDQEVDLFVMSCRVMALQVAVPFLATVLRESRKNLNGFKGRIVEGPRNEPCRELFAQAGFKAQKRGVFVLSHEAELAKVDASLYNFLLEGKAA